MASRGIFQLKQLQIFYCDVSGSSSGLLPLLPTIREKLNDKLTFNLETIIKRGIHPYILGLYINGYKKQICIKNINEEENLLERILYLRNQSGSRSLPHAGKKIYGIKKSIQGQWTPSLWPNYPQHEMEITRDFPPLEFPDAAEVPVQKPPPQHTRQRDDYKDSVKEIDFLMLNIINYWSYNLKKGLFTTYTIQERTLIVDGIEDYVKKYINALQCLQFQVRLQGNTKKLFKIEDQCIIVNEMPEMGITKQIFINYKPVFKIECLEYCEYSLESILSAYNNVMVYFINGTQDLLTKAKIKILAFNLLLSEIRKSAISNFNFTSQKNLSERMILHSINVKFTDVESTNRPFIQYKKESDLQQEVENFYIYDALKVSENQQSMGRRKSCDKDVGHKNVGGVQQIAMDLHSSNNYTYDILKKVAPLNTSPSQTQISLSQKTQVSGLSLYNNQSPSSSDSRSFTSYGLMNTHYIFDQLAQISPYPPDLHLRSRNSHQQQQQRVSRSKSNSITCDIFAELKLKPEPQEKKYKKRRN
ncbi:hypothetical protein pb186bvf_015960 [Paramecium bursaria]